MKKYLLLVALVAIVGCSSNYSKGYRVGIVRKFSHKGVLIKSYEGELLLGGVVSTGGKNSTLVNETFDFSIDPEAQHGENIEAIANQIDSAVESGKRVKLFYNQNTLPKVRSETGYFIYKVEVLEN